MVTNFEKFQNESKKNKNLVTNVIVKLWGF